MAPPSIVSLDSADASPTDHHDLTLWSREPAAEWTSALPLGNERLGAMVFGDPAHERIVLNEDSVWTGAPTIPMSPSRIKMKKGGS